MEPYGNEIKISLNLEDDFEKVTKKVKGFLKGYGFNFRKNINKTQDGRINAIFYTCHKKIAVAKKTSPIHIYIGTDPISAALGGLFTLINYISKSKETIKEEFNLDVIVLNLKILMYHKIIKFGLLQI